MSKKKEFEAYCRNFVGYMLKCLKERPDIVACMKYADNPDLESRSYGVLATFNVDIEKESRRIPFALVGAAICRAKPVKNGTYNLGEALASCYFDGQPFNKNDPDRPGARHMDSLLACDNILDARNVLRTLLPFIAGKAVWPLDYGELLFDLCNFGSWDQDRIKRKWARGFYCWHERKTEGKTENGEEK